MSINREQLVLDVISRKNTTYLPNIVNFANLKKKMECAAYVGITSEEEYDEYLTNHYKFTYTTDDAVSNGMDDTEKVELALASGRAHAIDNGHYALTTVLADGWEGIEVVRCKDLHPEADNSVVVNLTATVNGQKELKSQLIMKKSKRK